MKIPKYCSENTSGTAYRDIILSRQVMEFPRVGKYEVLCGDFHIHTAHSDGFPTVRERILEAWQYGYDVIAITDHGTFEELPVKNYSNYCQSYKEALSFAESLGIILMHGLETGPVNGEHYVALGFSNEYKPENENRWVLAEDSGQLFYQDRLRQLNKAGGLVIYAHPGEGLREHTMWGFEKGLIQGAEVFNGLSDAVCKINGDIRWLRGTLCYPDVFAWALRYNLAFFANSDAHTARGEQERNCPKPGIPSRTLVLTAERSLKGVMDGIRERRTIAWFGGMLWGMEKLLAEMISNLVNIKYKVDGEKKAWLRIRNLGPVAFNIVLQISPVVNKTVEIGPYDEVLVQCIPDFEMIFIRWENVWTSPTENLITTFKPTFTI